MLMFWQMKSARKLRRDEMRLRVVRQNIDQPAGAQSQRESCGEPTK